MNSRRRQSISTYPYNSNSLSTLSLRKKRSHSVTPGEPVVNAQPIIKSILKPYGNLEGENVNLDSQIVKTNIVDGASKLSSWTRDYEEAQDDFSNRTMSRRVSFASHAHVRVFETQDDNTNSTESLSSPTSSSSSPSQLSHQTPFLLKEKANSSSHHSVRVSSASSLNGEVSMSLEMDHNFSPLLYERQKLSDMSASINILPSGERLSDFDSDAENDDMEMTEAVSGHMQHKIISRTSQLDENGDIFMRLPPQNNESTSNTNISFEIPNDFTVPLSEALNKSKPPSDTWLALQAMTHSGTPETNIGSYPSLEQVSETEIDMDLTSAIMRLERARTHIIYEAEKVDTHQYSDISATDDEDTVSNANMDVDAYDRTTNITNLLSIHGDLGASVDVDGEEEHVLTLKTSLTAEYLHKLSTFRETVDHSPPSRNTHELDSILSQSIHSHQHEIVDRPIADLSDEENNVSISIDQFFLMTGIKFMDELTIPRRSVVYPMSLDSVKSTNTEATVGETIKALVITIPQSEIYVKVASNLQSWIESSKNNYRQAEEDTAKVTPGLFKEYAQTNDEGRSELLHELMLIKTNSHNAARSKWYDWKHGWITSLHAWGDSGRYDLEKDKANIYHALAQFENILPDLRQEQKRVSRELDEEQSEIVEIQNGDPMFIEELKVTIAEQNTALDAYQSDIIQMNIKLRNLSDKFKEVESQRTDYFRAMRNARERLCQYNNNTRDEIFKLKDELEASQNLHLWRASRIQENIMEYTYNDFYKVIIPCLRFRPIVRDLQITSIEDVQDKRQDFWILFREYIFSRNQKHICDCITIKQIIERLDDFWVSCAQLRSQLSLLGIKYPLELERIHSNYHTWTGLRAMVTVILKRINAKAIIMFTFNDDLISAWPQSVRLLKCDVNVVYGEISHVVIQDIVEDRLRLAIADEKYYACLLDACAEVTTKLEL